MKPTGIVRRVDELGRIVLPIELRRRYNIDVKDSLEIYVDEDSIILKRYEPADIFNGSTVDLIDYEGRKVSTETIRELAKRAGLEITN